MNGHCWVRRIRQEGRRDGRVWPRWPHPGRHGKCPKFYPSRIVFFPNFTQKCVNCVNFKIATKQRNLSENTVFTTFTSLHHVYLTITNTHKKTQQDQCLVEVRVVAVQAGSAEMALPLWASWLPGSLPCWPWRKSSTWERILDKDSPK